MEGLVPGRIVHFFDPKLDGPRAAMIVQVWGTNGTVNLSVFHDGSNDARMWAENKEKGGYYAAVDGQRSSFWATSIQHKSQQGEGAVAPHWDWVQHATPDPS